jgi:hypothetical protein
VQERRSKRHRSALALALGLAWVSEREWVSEQVWAWPSEREWVSERALESLLALGLAWVPEWMSERVWVWGVGCGGHTQGFEVESTESILLKHAL